MNHDIVIDEKSKDSIRLENGFLWKLIDQDMASAIIITGTGEVWELHDDGSESLIETWGQFENTKSYNATYALEGGHVYSSYRKQIQKQISAYLDYIGKTEGADAQAALLEDFKKIT